jgi:hypothetical protein
MNDQKMVQVRFDKFNNVLDELIIAKGKVYNIVGFYALWESSYGPNGSSGYLNKTLNLLLEEETKRNAKFLQRRY